MIPTGVNLSMASGAEPYRGDTPSGPESHHLDLLGGFVLRLHGVPVPIGRSAQRVIAYLAVAARPEQRELVAGSLWPEASDSRALGNLRSVLWQLRRRGVAVVADDRTWLWLTDVVVDIATFREVTARIMRSANDLDVTEGEVDLILNGHELLPRWSDEWLETTREHYRQLRVHALEALCTSFASAKRFGSAVQACLTAVEAEPLRDTSHRELIRVYLSEGNRADALRQYDAYRSLMLEELGLGPSPEIAALVEHIG